MSVESRKAFDLYNIFQKKSVPVKLYSNKQMIVRVLLMIIYLRKVHSYSDLITLSKARILGIEESDIVFLYVNGLRKLGDVPEQNIFENMRDKLALASLLANVGVNYPKTMRLEDARRTDFQGSIFLKPRWGMGSEGVMRYDFFDDLKIESSKKAYVDFIIQDAIPSKSKVVSSCMFCKDGKILSYYSHERIVTYPESDGVTVISKSFNDSQILGISKTLVSKTNYSGFLMVEFLYDSQRKSYFVIEINPRPWGSILLSEICESRLIDSYLTLEINITESKECFIKWPFPHLFFRFLKGHNDFKKYNDLPSGYINFTYSNIWRTSLFVIFYSLNLKKIIRKLWP